MKSQHILILVLMFFVCVYAPKRKSEDPSAFRRSARLRTAAPPHPMPHTAAAPNAAPKTSASHSLNVEWKCTFAGEQYNMQGAFVVVDFNYGFGRNRIQSLNRHSRLNDIVFLTSGQEIIVAVYFETKDFVMRKSNNQFYIMSQGVTVGYDLATINVDFKHDGEQCKVFNILTNLFQWTRTNLDVNFPFPLNPVLQVIFPFRKADNPEEPSSFANGRLGVEEGAGPEIIAHEFGHFVMWCLNGEALLIDGDIDPRHQPCKIEDPATAYIEGYAEAFSLVFNLGPNGNGQMRYLPTEPLSDYENYHCHFHNIDTDEGRIVAMMWDLYDLHNDYNDKNLDFGQKNGGDQNGDNPLSAREIFYSPLKLPNVGNKPANIHAYWSFLTSVINGDKLVKATQVFEYNWGVEYLFVKDVTCNENECTFIVSWNPVNVESCTLGTSVNGQNYLPSPVAIQDQMSFVVNMKAQLLVQIICMPNMLTYTIQLGSASTN